eukprot:TRINITY_DN29369_c0_g1_i1.p1 TRINITY_DN29369_c0_g1~~TRINITY_DN29369_c0_g1_i1.p1  ORF type:complete len:1045 (+),score=162.54 TRINITY_DN29369_c0_g1_i1:151-3285(+)
MGHASDGASPPHGRFLRSSDQSHFGSVPEKKLVVSTGQVSSTDGPRRCRPFAVSFLGHAVGGSGEPECNFKVTHLPSGVCWWSRRRLGDWIQLEEHVAAEFRLGKEQRESRGGSKAEAVREPLDVIRQSRSREAQAGTTTRTMTPAIFAVSGDYSSRLSVSGGSVRSETTGASSIDDDASEFGRRRFAASEVVRWQKQFEQLQAKLAELVRVEEFWDSNVLQRFLGVRAPEVPSMVRVARLNIDGSSKFGERREQFASALLEVVPPQLDKDADGEAHSDAPLALTTHFAATVLEVHGNDLSGSEHEALDLVDSVVQPCQTPAWIAIHGLRAGTTYEFQVRSSNAVGQSEGVRIRILVPPVELLDTQSSTAPAYTTALVRDLSGASPSPSSSSSASHAFSGERAVSDEDRQRRTRHVEEVATSGRMTDASLAWSSGSDNFTGRQLLDSSSRVSERKAPMEQLPSTDSGTSFHSATDDSADPSVTPEAAAQATAAQTALTRVDSAEAAAAQTAGAEAAAAEALAAQAAAAHIAAQAAAAQAAAARAVAAQQEAALAAAAVHPYVDISHHEVSAPFAWDRQLSASLSFVAEGEPKPECVDGETLASQRTGAAVCAENSLSIVRCATGDGATNGQSVSVAESAVMERESMETEAAVATETLGASNVVGSSECNAGGCGHASRVGAELSDASSVASGLVANDASIATSESSVVCIVADGNENSFSSDAKATLVDSCAIEEAKLQLQRSEQRAVGAADERPIRSGYVRVAGLDMKRQCLPEGADVFMIEKLVAEMQKQSGAEGDTITFEQAFRLVIGCGLDIDIASQKKLAVLEWRRANRMEQVRAHLFDGFRSTEASARPEELPFVFPHYDEMSKLMVVNLCAMMTNDGFPVTIWHVGTLDSGAVAKVSSENLKVWSAHAFEYVDVWLSEESARTRQLIGHVQVFDLQGMSMWHVTNSALIEKLKLAFSAGEFYVEAAAHIYVVNSSSAFTMAWKIVKTLISPRTSSKITVTSNVPSELLNSFGSDPSKASRFKEILKAKSPAVPVLRP